ncbi:MAG: ATPase [Candidatus Thiodiazotropha endolucinida]|nr:ATPase [Candidatus Thiodiazotropha taylori]MCG8060527.1 ATPase [Candidatus Thiodiazotropha taylori]MCW4345255.1 ATPase [Candidatus Thiodiazotropha endolucinida]MCW4349654.1 ATPase [Candidatus Thiodiazotropha endolucinida]
MKEQHYTYARFWKCALQVNPHAYSENYRGEGHGMDAQSYAEALRDVCLAEGIQVVGLADHGSVADAEIVRKVLTEAGVVVFPGFEVATSEKVHWVCLFPEDSSAQQLERYLGKLHLTNPKDGVRPSDLGGQQMLAAVEDLGGFCFAAHVTSNSGLLKGKFNNLWTDARLRAAQIPGTIDVLPPEYRPIALNQNPDYKREHPMALINAKDVAKPDDLQDSRASSFIKMTRPCFASFLMAFKDPESRVRLSDQMEEHYYSQIDSISIEGGYFDGLSAEVSGHLNAVIGGRGTGKSTLLECLRYALDIPHKGGDAIRQGDQIVKENLGRAGGRVILKLRSAANHMKPYTVIRRYGEPPRVVDEQGNESRLHPGRDLLPGVEIYGQNEIYELAKSPGALTRVLDRFLPESSEQQARLDSAYRKLRDNSERLAKAQDQKDETERQIAQLPRLEEQVRQFKEQGLEEKLKQVPLLEKERQLGPRVLEELNRVHSGQRGLEESLPEVVFLSDKALEGLPHAELLQRGRQILEKLNTTLRQKLVEIEKAVGEAETALSGLVSELNRALVSSESQLEKEFSKLPAVAGKDGKEIGRSYQRLLREIEQVKPAQARLKTVDALVKELEQARRNLLGEISDIRSARTAAKQKTVKGLNKRLAGKLRITLVPDGLRQPLRDFLQGLPGVGERKTEWVDEAQDFTVLGLVAAIREGKDALLTKEWGLTSGLAETLTRMTPGQLYELEGTDLEDRISLELNVSHSGEQYRALDRLSTGQQCTAILHLLLLDNPDPLIMDQPEDNLDNAFIAERIVQELRAAKTERQFLFATHNANIPVFGDAEWIGVCSATEERAEMSIDAQGSIDIPVIRDQVASILEGGKEAFMQRKEKYGFDY